MTTEIIVLLDQSGSMTKLKEDVFKGFNAYVKEQEQLGRTMVTTMVFNRKHQVLWQQIPAEETVMDEQDYKPGGMTALLDTVGFTLEETLERHASLKPEEVPSKVIVVIVSDGINNASQTYTYETTSELIKDRQAAGWEFVFLGASLEAGREAYKLKIEKADAYYHPHTSQGISDLFKAATNATNGIRRREKLKNDTDENGKANPAEEENEIPFLKLPQASKKMTYAEHRKRMQNFQKRIELKQSIDRFYQVTNKLQQQVWEEKKKQ